MIDDKRLLAIIPARGGSKRLPRKNVIQLGGRPMISYTIAAGLGSRHIDKLAVSTDDPETAQIAAAWGAPVPFLRPASLATDETSSFEVLRHAVEYFAATGAGRFDFVVMLQPTSPLRGSADIDGAVALLRDRKADAVISVCECEHSPLWANTLPDDRSMANFLPDGVKNRRSQDLPLHYRLNGAIYICRIERMLEEKTLFLRDNIYAYLMPREKSVDVDTMLDLKLCEALLSLGPKVAGCER